MKALLLILSIAFCATTFAQVTELIQTHFTAKQIQTANTAEDATYLTEKDKQVIQYLNLARLYPKDFIPFYIAYLESEDPEYGFKKYKTHNKYYYGLVKDLKKVKKLKALTPDKNLTELAKCWATESGKKGVIGHHRRKCAKNGFSAECCSYLYGEDAMEHVLNLLIDEDIPDFGHRRIMLSPYTKLGVGYAPHKKYGNCMVMDFI